MKIIDRKFLNVQTKTCHASSICFFQDKPVYAWFGSNVREGAPDSAIYIQYNDKIATIGEDDQMPRWNPILFPYEDKLFLFVKSGLRCDSWWTSIYNISNIFDEDFDISKIKSHILVAGLNGPTKTKPLVVNDFIYCGSSAETLVDWTASFEIYRIIDGQFNLVYRTNPLTVDKVIYEDKYYGRRQSMGIIQPTIWKVCDTFHAFFRSSRGLGKIYHSSWESYGDRFCGEQWSVGWSKPKPTNFKNPNSSIDCVAFNDRLFLVYNPSSENRYPLMIHKLGDKFEIKDEIVIAEKIESGAYSPEFSYPFILEHCGRLHLTYTKYRTKIEEVTIEV